MLWMVFSKRFIEENKEFSWKWKWIDIRTLSLKYKARFSVCLIIPLIVIWSYLFNCCWLKRVQFSIVPRSWQTGSQYHLIFPSPPPVLGPGDHWPGPMETRRHKWGPLCILEFTFNLTKTSSLPMIIVLLLYLFTCTCWLLPHSILFSGTINFNWHCSLLVLCLLSLITIRPRKLCN